MILDEKTNELIDNINGETNKFEIEASAKMFDLLSSKIYEDPIRSVIRELCCNAMDAHTAINLDKPIQVFLPTDENKSLIIKDIGIGMTHEDILTVYKSYGKSTKANSNQQIGALGLGGKTPLAYTDQFVLTTSKDGVKNEYICFRDENRIPNVTQVSSSDTFETGTTIEIIVEEKDIHKFYKAAAQTFLFFNTMPSIKRGEKEFYNFIQKSFIGYGNKDIRKNWDEARLLAKSDYTSDLAGRTETHIILHSIIKSYNTNFGAVMGQIFYGVNAELIYDNEYYGDFSEAAFRFPAEMNFRDYVKFVHVNMGDIHFQASRELLNYSDKTKKCLTEKFYKNFNDYIIDFKSKYNTPQLFIKNIDKIRNRWLFNYKSEQQDVVYIKDLYNKSIDLFFTKSKLKNNYYFFNQEYSSGKTIYFFKIENDSIKKDLFDKIFLKKQVQSILVLDDTKEIDAVDKFWTKNKNSKSRPKIASPIAISNKIREKYGIGKASLIVTIEENSQLEKLSKLTKIVSSSISVSKKSAVKKSTGPRNVSGLCFDKVKNVYIENSKALKIFNDNNKFVTYELFEGDPIAHRGWFFDPNLEKIKSGEKGNKKDFISVTTHGFYSNDNYDLFVKRISALKEFVPEVSKQIPDYHFLIDWNFYKKNNIHELEKNNSIHIKLHYLQILEQSFDTIKSKLINPVKINSIFKYVSTAEDAEKYGIKKFGEIFKNTLIYEEILNYIKTKTTNFDNIERMKNTYHVLTFMEEGLTNISSFGKNIIERRDTLHQKVKQDIKVPEPIIIDNKEKLIKRYELLNYIDMINVPASKLIDYTGMVDNI